MSTVLTAMEKARAAWGVHMPDWVKALAEACDEAGLRKTAAKLHVSSAMASLAINRKRIDLSFIKYPVEKTLMVTMVACPVLGVMGRDECLREQAKPFSSVNPLRVQLFKTCRGGCPYYKEKNHVERTDQGSGKRHRRSGRDG